jgi:hypothetical protein
MAREVGGTLGYGVLTMTVRFPLSTSRPLRLSTILAQSLKNRVPLTERCATLGQKPPHLNPQDKFGFLRAIVVSGHQEFHVIGLYNSAMAVYGC